MAFFSIFTLPPHFYPSSQSVLMGVRDLANMLSLLPYILIFVVFWCLLVSPVLLSMTGEVEDNCGKSQRSGLDVRISSLILMGSQDFDQ